MIKNLIFNTAKEAFRRGYRKYKKGQRKTESVPYDLVKSSIKRSIRSTKFMDKAAYQQAPKTASLPKGGPRPRLIGKAYASDKRGKGLQIPMISAKERKLVQQGISDSVRKFMKDKIGRKAKGGDIKVLGSIAKKLSKASKAHAGQSKKIRRIVKKYV